MPLSRNVTKHIPALAAALVLGGLPAAHADFNITVDPTTPLQTITGFGASDAWQAYGIHNSYSPAVTNEILDLLFSPVNGAGLSMLRHRIPVEIEPAKGQWDWNQDYDSIWLTNQAIQRGVQTVWSTPWSPPAWMKTNNNVNYGGSLAPEHYQDYADYLVTYIKQYKALFGITISAVSLQNEPDQTTPYESCTWSDSQFHDFMKNNLIPTFVANGITTKVVLGEMSYWSDSDDNQSLADPLTAPYVGVVATHDYGGNIYGFGDALAAGKPIWETEVSSFGPNDPSITDGLNWAASLHDALIQGHVSAWHYWWALASPNDNEELIGGNSGDNSLVVNKRLWTIGNFSKFIRPGYKLVSTGQYGNYPEWYVRTTAFQDPATGDLVVVGVNQNNFTSNVTVNLPAGYSVATPYRTSFDEDILPQQPVAVTNNSFTYPLTADSITTFVIPKNSPAVVHLNVQDSGFETPAIGYGNFQYFPSGTPWTFGGGGPNSGAGVTANNSGFTYANYAAPEGDQVGFVQSVGSISQTLWSPLPATWTVKVTAAQRGNHPQTVNVLIDNNVVGYFTPGDSSWGDYTVTAAVGAGSHLLTFQGTTPEDTTAFIDNVRVTIPSNPAAPIPGVYYKLVNKHSGKVAGVSGMSTAPDAPLVQWDDNGTPDHLWRFILQPAGGYKLINYWTHNAMGISGASKTAGAGATSSVPSRSSDQTWGIKPQVNGYVRLVDFKSGQDLGVAGASTDDGASVLQWPNNGGDDHSWWLEPALP